MNASTLITGERIAKDVVKRSRALEILSQPQRPLWFSYFSIAFIPCSIGAAVLGIAWFTDMYSPNIVALILAGAGYCLAVMAMHEAIRVRKRLDAVVTLLHQDEMPS